MVVSCKQFHETQGQTWPCTMATQAWWGSGLSIAERVGMDVCMRMKPGLKECLSRPGHALLMYSKLKRQVWYGAKVNSKYDMKKGLTARMT
eukprot:1160103-Pelagomonas_calceolata.AAC.2